MDTVTRYAAECGPQLLRLFEYWDAFFDGKVRFNRPFSKIHGPGHCRRVLLHALAVGEAELGHNIEALEILAQASVFHDTRRLNEGPDTGHGARAAAYYREYCAAHPEVTFHPETVLLIRYHDLNDRKGIEAIRKQFGNDSPEVERMYAIFKDADALDRHRLGPYGLDPLYLRTPAARGRVDFAKQLVDETVDRHAYRDICRHVAKIMERFHKMLLIVDAQYDFIDGSLPVPGAQPAMDALARYIRQTNGQYTVRAFTADCHPADHISFSENGGEWPAHCVADTRGAEIWSPIVRAVEDTSGTTLFLPKGNSADREEYSVFANSESAAILDKTIRSLKIMQIDICGLAGDICVARTLSDGKSLYPDVRWRLLQPFSPTLK